MPALHAAHPAEASTPRGAIAVGLPHIAGVPLCSGGFQMPWPPCAVVPVVVSMDFWLSWSSPWVGFRAGHGFSCSLQSTCTSPAWLELTEGSWGMPGTWMHTFRALKCTPGVSLCSDPGKGHLHPLEKSQGRANLGKEAQTGAGALPGPGWSHPGTGTGSGWVLAWCWLPCYCADQNLGPPGAR